jgi:hypothetical protein
MHGMSLMLLSNPATYGLSADVAIDEVVAVVRVLLEGKG